MSPGKTHSRGQRSDRKLIAACLRGDEPAWAELLTRYRRLIFSIPVAYRMPRADAEEIFQQVALRLFRHLDRLKRAEGLPAWLVVTTRRLCQDRLRGNRHWHPLDEAPDEPAIDPPDVAGRLHRVECQHALALALERLEDLCRRLIAALYVEDPRPSYDEIARRLGRPIGSLGPTRARCLEKLRKKYVEQGGPEP